MKRDAPKSFGPPWSPVLCCAGGLRTLRSPVPVDLAPRAPKKSIFGLPERENVWQQTGASGARYTGTRRTRHRSAAGGHMTDSDIILVGSKCAMPGCQRWGYFGDGVSPELFCRMHKSPEHVQLRGYGPETTKNRKECIVPGCAEIAKYGPHDGIKSKTRSQKRKLVRCRKHKLPDDLPAATLRLLASGRFCQHISDDVPSPSQPIPGLDPSRCTAAATYGDPSVGVPKFCGKHKPPGYVNVTPRARRYNPIIHRHLIQLFDGPSFNGLVDESEFGISPGSNRSEDYSSPSPTFSCV